MSTDPLLADTPNVSNETAHKRLAIFRDQVEEMIGSDAENGFLQCRSFIEGLYREGGFTEVVNRELSHLSQDPNYVLAASTDAEMLVCKSAHFTLILKLLKDQPRRDRLFGLPFDHILLPLNSRGVTIRRYHQPHHLATETFDRTRRLEFKGEETLLVGQTSCFRAGQDIFLIKDDQEEPPLVASFLSSAKSSIRWEYDAATLLPIRAVASEAGTSRLEFLAGMMAAMDYHAALPALQSLLQHPAHFVRWAALRAISRLDAGRAPGLLHAAMEDSHEHIRNAAIRALAAARRLPNNIGDGSAGSPTVSARIE